MPERCRLLFEQIRASQSVCVHIRRGDYVSNVKAALIHGTCSIEYYQRASASLATTLLSPHCYVFSDDPNWVRNSFRLTFPTTVVDVNTGMDASWDLFLMSQCKHFVIANSTFSWWAAWLGDEVNKRVIAPRNWFHDDSKNTKDLLPAEWELIWSLLLPLAPFGHRYRRY